MRTLSELLFLSPSSGSDRAALIYRGETKTYAQLEDEVRTVAAGLINLGLEPQDRVAVFLDKQFETVTAMLGATAAGLVLVPINPVLRAAQVAYIMRDCRVLITTRSRLASIESALHDCPDLRFVFLVDGEIAITRPNAPAIALFQSLLNKVEGAVTQVHAAESSDMAAILYTSGSTGNPKGVVFSHRNLLAGAQSVSQYLEYDISDRIINIPPYSFDFGLNQLLSSLCVGATAVLHNFVTADDLMETIAAEQVTGVSGVPTVMIQLATMQWPPDAVQSVRYLSTTGGRMPESAVKALRQSLPNADIYLMYGLTEAFRSTYLPPSEIDRRPNSIGKAIPNAEVLVVRPDGTICDPEEPGELVHKGVLVTMGYWNDPVRTAERFRPAPGEHPDKPNPEIAVWSGDTVKRDVDGFIYYVGRTDEMIKTSGYRISPTEIEEVVFSSGRVAATAAIGVEHEILGQSIVVFAVPKDGKPLDSEAIIAHCRKIMPAYMVPQKIIGRSELPLNPNGKIDRKHLKQEYSQEGVQSFGVVTAPPTDRIKSFFDNWLGEIAEILGMRSKGFGSVIEAFRWAFPDRPISSQDSFISLGGDSISYVALSLELAEVLGQMPEDWADRSISELEAERREQTKTASAAPDILLRVVAMLGAVFSHVFVSENYVESLGYIFSGSATLMLLISGLSFARFNWSEDPWQTLRSTTRFLTTIMPPALLLIILICVRSRTIDWPLILFVGNLTDPTPPKSFIGVWYIQLLLQFVLLTTLMGFIPGLTRFSFRHSFGFAISLVIAGLAAFLVFTVARPAAYADYFYLPQYYFWIFAMGWLFATVQTPEQRLAAFAILLGSIVAVIAADVIYSVPSFRDIFWLWLSLGGAYLLMRINVRLPMLAYRVLVVLARSMLFVFLFHWPIASHLPINSPALRIALGALLSVGLWIAWESFRRTVRLSQIRPASGQLDYAK